LVHGDGDSNIPVPNLKAYTSPKTLKPPVIVIKLNLHLMNNCTDNFSLFW
jgi:hypothetical protein